MTHLTRDSRRSRPEGGGTEEAAAAHGVLQISAQHPQPLGRIHPRRGHPPRPGTPRLALPRPGAAPQHLNLSLWLRDTGADPTSHPGQQRWPHQRLLILAAIHPQRQPPGAAERDPGPPGYPQLPAPRGQAPHQPLCRECAGTPVVAAAWYPRRPPGRVVAGRGGSWHPGCHPPGWWQHGARGIWGVYSAAGGTQYVGCPSGMVVVEAQGDTWHLGCPPWQGADGGHTRHPGCLHYGGLAVGEGGHPRVSPQQSRSGGGRGTPSAPTTRPTDPVLRLPADAPGQRLGEAEPGQPGRGGGQRPCHPHQAGRRGGGGGGGTRQGPQPSPPCPPHRPFVPRASC